MCRNSFSHAEGGATTSFDVVITCELEVLAILKGGGGVCKKFYPVSVLRGLGAQKVSEPRFPHVVPPPSS